MIQPSSEAQSIREQFPAMLLSAADRFQVADLAELCAQHLVKSISVANAVDILILAEETNSPMLKVRATIST